VTRLRRELEGRSTICCGETLARLLFDLAFDSVGFKACVGCCESEVTSKDLELCRVLAVLRVAEPFSFTPFYGARVLRVQRVPNDQNLSARQALQSRQLESHPRRGSYEFLVLTEMYVEVALPRTLNSPAS